MNFKTAIKTASILFLAVICNIELMGQCPEILSTSLTNDELCPGDSFTISLTGTNLPDGGTIDYFLSPTSAFNPYAGEGEFIGSSDISTPCVQGPTILFALLDAPTGPDRCDEFIAIHTGSGLSNVDDLVINSNFGFHPYAAGNPNNYSGCIPTILNPGEPVPPNVILIVQGAYNTENGDIYDITNLCNQGLPVYVIASSNTSCGGGHFTNTGTHTYSVETPCGDDSFTYTGVSDPTGTTWDNVNGYTTGSFNVENVQMPPFMNHPSTISVFMFTVDEDFCDMYGSGTIYIKGIINPTPSSSCSPLETTSTMAINVTCSEYELTPVELCNNILFLI